MTKKTKNKQLKVIGLTGGLATGKTATAEILRDEGFLVVCADAIAHDVVAPGKPALEKIKKAFGPAVFNREKLNRKKLAAVVFASASKRKILEQIIHPYVKKEIKTILSCLQNHDDIVFLDVPLLFEAGMFKLCDLTICVITSQKQQIERAMTYRKMTRAEALARIKAQMPLREKAKKADFVIENNGTVKALQKKVCSVINKL